MFPLISAVIIILIALRLTRLLPAGRKRRQQVRFIRETLAAERTFDNRRVIASLSTVPDRINNLRPTIRSLLEQTRPPDEIVLAIPQFSIRSGGVTQCRNMFRVGRECVFCIVAGIGGRPRSLFPSFEKSWGLAGGVH